MEIIEEAEIIHIAHLHAAILALKGTIPESVFEGLEAQYQAVAEDVQTFYARRRLHRLRIAQWLTKVFEIQIAPGWRKSDYCADEEYAVAWLQLSNYTLATYGLTRVLADSFAISFAGVEFCAAWVSEFRAHTSLDLIEILTPPPEMEPQ